MCKIQLFILKGPFEAEGKRKFCRIVEEFGRRIAQTGDKTEERSVVFVQVPVTCLCIGYCGFQNYIKDFSFFIPK